MLLFVRFILWPFDGGIISTVLMQKVQWIWQNIVLVVGYFRFFHESFGGIIRAWWVVAVCLCLSLSVRPEQHQMVHHLRGRAEEMSGHVAVFRRSLHPSVPQLCQRIDSWGLRSETTGRILTTGSQHVWITCDYSCYFIIVQSFAL